MAKKTLTQDTTNYNNVQSLADIVEEQATLVKQTFDKAGNDQKTFMNGTHITELQDSTDNTSGSFGIGHGSVSITADNVGDALEENRQAIDNLETADGQNVKLTGNQTISGIKTFNSLPKVPTVPVANEDVASKQYVDSQAPLTIPDNSINFVKFTDENKEITTQPRGYGGDGLINGDFQVWQRGTSFDNPANIYTADRQLILNLIDNNIRVFRDSPVKEGHKYSYRIEGFTALGGSGALTSVEERIENFENYKGQDITFTVELNADVGANGIIFVFDGVTTTIAPFTGDGTLQKITLTKTVSSAATSLSADVQLIRDALPVGVGLNIQTRKLELGNNSSKFIPKRYIDELIQCYRYTQPLNGGSTNKYSSRFKAYTPDVIFIPIPLINEMRVNPSLVAGIETTDWSVSDYPNATPQTGFTLSLAHIGKSYVSLQCNKVSHGLTDGCIVFKTDGILLVAEM